MAVFPGEATPLFVSGEKHYRHFFKAPPLIRSDLLKCAIHIPLGKTGEKKKCRLVTDTRTRLEINIQREKKMAANMKAGY